MKSELQTVQTIRRHERAVVRPQRLAPLYPTTLGLRERDRLAMIARHRRIISKLTPTKP